MELLLEQNNRRNGKMKQVIKIDTNGLFVGDVILEDADIMPNDCIEIPCPEGFYKPKWDGTQWVEGMSQTDIDILSKATQISDIKSQLANLDTVLPRSVEDLITSQKTDITTLPQIMQDRLKQKQALRQSLNAQK
jgi:hypothetical protein